VTAVASETEYVSYVLQLIASRCYRTVQVWLFERDSYCITSGVCQLLCGIWCVVCDS